MSAGPTLNSRLRVLVAKTFRAEKLYSSIRNTRGERLASVSNLSEMANDIRAREWQRTHFQLRTSLNDILSLGTSSEIAEEVALLCERFDAQAEKCRSAVDAGALELVDTAKRHEFAHIFKISIELIRQKARGQANRVIADELRGVLEASGRRVQPRAGASRVESEPSNEEAAELEGLIKEVAAEPEPVLDEAVGDNVIPFRRKIAGALSRR